MDCVSQQKHIIVIVEMRTNCGCRQVEHYEESPIVSSQGITSQIPKVGFPQTTAENELRKEIIWEFCKILNNLKCGIHQDLDFILSKLALIAKAKYEHELEPSSQLEDVLRPIFNELQVDMDNLTTEEVDELIRKYENVTLLLRGPRGPRGLDGTVAFEDLTPGQIESLRGPQGEPFTYADFTPEQIAVLQNPATEAANAANQRINAVDQKIIEITNAINTWNNTYVSDITSKINAASTATENANDATSAANTAAQNANTKATEAGRINISIDGTTITITDRNGNTTNSNIKGDIGEGFSIYRTYISITAMNADKANVAEGKFVLIASNVEDEDNAKLYVRGAENFIFLTDLSGAQGIQGNTPIIQSGTIVTGNSGTSVVATLTPNGNDANGNPIYLLNLTIPRGNPFVYSDFTQQQLEGLKGKSAYQLYVDNTSDNPVLSESDWINSLYGTDGITPHIDQTTGNWFIGNTNTNVRASFSNLPAEENGTDLSLVTTGEKYLWNNVSDVLGNIAYINENVEGQENIPIIPDNPSQNSSVDFIVDVEEDGLYFIDEQGNIGAQLTENGFNAIGLHDVLRITNY